MDFEIITPNIASHVIIVQNYGNGEAGFNGCGPTPNLAGSSGGQAGDFRIAPIEGLAVFNSFRGGRGGDGSPPGS